MADFTVELVPVGDTGTFHSSNLPDEDFRRILARTPNDRSPLTMRIKLVEVHHGNVVHEQQNYEATLLVLEFRFQSRLQNRRYESASVTLEFFDKTSPGKPKHDPVVSGLAPDHVHWLNKTTFDKNISYGATAGINPTWAEASAEWKVEYTKPSNFKATLTGIPGMSKGKIGEDNAVTWAMEQNHAEADGIPSFLQTAVLLRRRHPGPFVAKLRVKTQVNKISLGYRLFPTRTDEDKIIDPITIDPGVVQVQNNSVTGIDDKDLCHMEMLDIDKYLKVNLSEQNPLHAQEGPSGHAQNVATEPLQPPLEPMKADVVVIEAAETAGRAILIAAQAAEAAGKAALLAAEAAKATAGAAEAVTKAVKAVADMAARMAGAETAGSYHSNLLGTNLSELAKSGLERE